ncbi:hypothetical protein BUALT_Bualt05G0138700 [Buddleja alternifolia]|uniref:Uncharacterized protein n=1 Tax=Buddleja alternifolia TaxID=168488 RepID=A0AAV6XKJ2_9LAMI|nr:hypothetical protein BUALT_Bualt05G0138700 [Buddleja alternifolia]
MFASQLLRILQTIPSDVKYDTCVSAAVEDMTMTEYDSKSFRRETDSLSIGSKEIYQLNGPIRDTNALVFEAKGRDERWNPFLDDFSMDNENGTIDSPGKEDQNGISYHPSNLEKETYLLSSDTNAKATLEEFTHCDASDLFETNTNLFTDKTVLECEQPELIIRYKEINYHIVKDICVDEGRPLKDNFFNESSKDDQSGHSFAKPNDNRYCEGTVVADMELFISDGSAASSLDKTEGASANDCGSKEEIDGKLLAQESPKLTSESSFEEDTPKHSGETDSRATSMTGTDASEEDSFIDKTLPFQEFGTRSFLRSFLHSLDDEGTKAEQPPGQISSEENVSGNPDALSAEAGPKEDVQPSSLDYNSQVERGAITFNFNSPSPAVAEVTNGITENVKEQPLDSGNLLEHKDEDAGHVQCNSSKDQSVHEQSINIQDNGLSNDFSAPSQAECVSSKNVNDENVHHESPTDEDENCDDLSSEGQVRNSVSSDGLTGEPCVCEHEHWNTGDDPVVSQVKCEGELSFSAASLITYSGPIAYSGSLSVRSDSSATSARSFAFPILQSEWNSSPVRMAKADGTHCRKHKGWRSGLLCCRF